MVPKISNMILGSSKSLLAAAIMALTPCAAEAEDLPPLDYFEGRYEVVGRVSGEPVQGPTNLSKSNNKLLIDAGPLGAGWLSLHGGDSEVLVPLQGELRGDELLCLFVNDPDNYPVLVCRYDVGADGAFEGLLTFWPNP